MKRIAFFSIWIILTVVVSTLSTFEVAAAPAIGSTITTVYPIADSYVNQTSPDTNYGEIDGLRLRYETSYAYIMFDLSNLPPNATVISAALKLYLTDIGGYVGNINTHYCSDNSWTELGITWNNKPDFASEATDEHYFGMLVWVDQYYSWNVTADVRVALTQGKLTEVIVRKSSGHAFFHSREGAHKPKLEVEYSVKPIYDVHLESVQDTGASSNLGYITFADETFFLPADVPVVAGSYEVTYNSGYVFLRWETSGGVSVSDAYTKTTTVTVSDAGTLMAVGSGETIEYSYDDGTTELSTSKKSGQMVAVKFTPVLWGKLTTVRIYFSYISYNASNNVVKVHVLEGLVPKKDLIEPLTETPTSKGWFDVDLSAYGVTVTAGNDFYVAVEWTVDYSPNIGEDSSQPDERSWSWDGADWNVDKYHDFMIRAVVRAEVGKEPSTITCSPSPSTVTIGSSVTVSGSISPARSGVKVTLNYTRPDGSVVTRTATTTATGDYSDVYTPDSVGSWSVYASWAGDEVYAGATSPEASFTVTEAVTKTSSLISCMLSSSTISIGESVAISGSISPSRPSVTVYLEYSTNGGTTWKDNASVTTDSSSAYSYTWTPASVGSYLVQSYWNGDAEYEAAKSAAQSLEVKKVKSTISCSASPTSIIIGSSTKISGSILPAVANAEVTISYRVTGGTWSTLLTVSTTSEGGYSYTWTPTAIGTYDVKASWAGDGSHSEAESGAVTIKVREELSEITCALSSEEITKGETITVTGSLSPAYAGVTITLTFTKPDGSAFTRQVTTTSDGKFSATYIADASGTWSVSASWAGDEEHPGSVSPTASFEVTKIPSTISCSIYRTPIKLGETVTISGYVSPPVGGASVTLTYKRPDASTFKSSITTASDGSFSDTYTPDKSGGWSVTSGWAGDKEHEGATSSQVSFTIERVSPLSPIDYLTRPDILAIILAVISLLGGGAAWFMGRRRRVRVKTLLDEVDEVYSRFKMNSRRCEAELYRLKDVTLEKLKIGKIDESSYDVIKDRIDEYLHEIRERIVDERLGGFPSKLRDALRDMIKKGEISEKEYETLGRLIERTAELKEREKAQLRELLEKWKKDYLKKQ